MDEISALLRERERQGLRWFLIALMIASGLWTAIGTTFITSSSGKLFVGTTGLLDMAIMAVLLWALARRRSPTLVGFASILVAFATIAPSPFMEWQGAGIETVPAAYLVKTGLPAALVICALSAITLQPSYPLAVTGLALVYQLALLAIGLDDPRTSLATQATWEEHVMGDAIHRGKVAYTLGLTVATGIAISVVAWVARLTVRRAVALEQANGQLRRYFSPEVAERIATADADFMKPGGRVREVVVLVSDLEAFTPLSHALGPDETLKLLADYQARMTAAIFVEGGSVDKFTGDGILATFGATGALPDSSGRAVRAAIGMNRALDELNAERAARGRPVLRQRIGLHAGPALVGNVGTVDRLEFTVIGDVVNLASRIEQACKVTGDAILASRAVFDAAGGGIAAVARGVVPLPGVESPPELMALRAGGAG